MAEKMDTSKKEKEERKDFNKINTLDLVAQLANNSLKNRPSVESILGQEGKPVNIASEKNLTKKVTKRKSKKINQVDTTDHYFSNISDTIQVKKNQAPNGKVHVRIHARLAHILRQHILNGGTYLSPIIELIIIDFCKRHIPQSAEAIDDYIKNFIDQKGANSK